jgi:hypothetical protein
VEGTKRTLLAIKRGENGLAAALEGEGHEDEMGGLTLSPDGRYLLFGANRHDRAAALAPLPTTAAGGDLRLAENED